MNQTLASTTQLIKAIKSGHHDTATQLIQPGTSLATEVNINTPLPDGSSILHLAIKHRNYQIIKLLLNNGANPNHIHNDKSLLHEAAKRNNIKLAALLITAGANINLYTNAYYGYRHIQTETGAMHQHTPFDLAVAGCKYRMMEYLVASGYTLADKPIGYHYILLKYAIVHHKYDLLKLLISLGANVNSYNSKNQSLLLFGTFSYHGNIRILKILVDNNINIHEQDDTGTILHSIASCMADIKINGLVYELPPWRTRKEYDGRKEMMIYLIHSGVDLYVKDNGGRLMNSYINDTDINKLMESYDIPTKGVNIDVGNQKNG